MTVQRKLRGGRWTRLAVVATDGRGYWTLSRRIVPGTHYRFQAAGRTSAALKG